MTASRLLTSAGPDAREYEIRAEGGPVLAFTTGPVNGKSADETAVGNLLDYSERHDGAYVLVWLPSGLTREPVPLAAARDGVGYMLAPQDDVAADAQHSGPLDWAAEAHAVRRSLIEPTVWGAAS